MLGRVDDGLRLREKMCAKVCDVAKIVQCVRDLSEKKTCGRCEEGFQMKILFRPCRLLFLCHVATFFVVEQKMELLKT